MGFWQFGPKSTVEVMYDPIGQGPLAYNHLPKKCYFGSFFWRKVYKTLTF